MKKLTLIILASLSIIIFAATIVMAGVTEMKIYTNEHPSRGQKIDGVVQYFDDNLNHRANRFTAWNTYIDWADMNSDVMTVPEPDSGSCWVTDDAAIGPWALNYHIVNMPDPRITWGLKQGEEHLDASSTDRITMWIKSRAGNLNPLYMRIICTKFEGADVEGVATPITGETIIRADDFGFHEAVSHKPFNGEWQFISIPWTFFVIHDAAEAQAVIPYSWAGMREGTKYLGGPKFMDGNTGPSIRRLVWDSLWGGEASDWGGHYPFPAGKTIEDYVFDEVVLTMNEGTGVTDVDGKASVMPLAYELRANYPNPFNPSTTIEYALPVSNHVSIDVFNGLGVKVRTLVSRNMTAGTYKATWDATDDHGNKVPSGIYFYKMNSSHFNSVQKMILMK
jgi:hypothetical protein